MTLCIFLCNTTTPLKIGVKEKGFCGTDNEELGVCVCVQDQTHMPRKTLKYFRGSISNKLDIAVYHKETLHKFKTFQKLEKEQS